MVSVSTGGGETYRTDATYIATPTSPTSSLTAEAIVIGSIERCDSFTRAAFTTSQNLHFAAALCNAAVEIFEDCGGKRNIFRMSFELV